MPRKTVAEKLQTKIRHLILRNPEAQVENQTVSVRGNVLLRYTNAEIAYTTFRYYPSKVEDLIEEDYSVTIILSHENLTLINSNPINPPNAARNIIRLIRSETEDHIDNIVLGSAENEIEDNTIRITKDLYETLNQINREEGKDKRYRVRRRCMPFLLDDFGLNVEDNEMERDYALLLREVIASGQVNQADIVDLMQQLELGEINHTVIERQVTKQVRWLIDSIEQVLEEVNLTKVRAKDLGHEIFGFTKISVTGPEHLMEKILTKFGQYTLFGVPALLNTDKYVTHDGGLSNMQFDLILIDHLGDVEVVELKRPDKYLLSYDGNRAKFYASRDLSIAISQAERYISAVYHDNDEEWTINNMRIRDFINSEVGDAISMETVRPTAVIIMGSYQTISKPYNSLSDRAKENATEADYRENSHRAYKELKSAHKNIKILTYSELLENARTRLELSEEEE